MKNGLVESVQRSVFKFIEWLDRYGETSFDHQTYYVGPFGRRAKALYYKQPMIGILAVSPMVFSEAFLPAARQLFWKKQRLPIADAHYAMGFAYLNEMTGERPFLARAEHFLGVLKETRCKEYEHYGWGYPFDWITRTGVVPEGTPLVTTTPYAYEAFLDVYRLDQKEEWKAILRSIAEHTYNDIGSYKYSENAYGSAYTPTDDTGRVVNASAYRGALLSSAYTVFKDEKYKRSAEQNIEFVLQTQKPNGSWPYHAEDQRDFIDHFHTCFVMKGLAKFKNDIDYPGIDKALEKGIDYYINNLFDEDKCPKPFSQAPRLTVYKNELYDYAECINLCVLLRDKFPVLNDTLEHVLSDILNRWQKADGAYRSRKLLLGWDNVPMHRWAQSQLFRSLALFLNSSKKDEERNQ